ncbi:unnamed protein product, partial [Symbiodinium microadriaticum]
KLLTDYSQSAKDTIDRNKRVPDLDDLLRQVELDELTDSATNRDEEETEVSSLSREDDSNHDGNAEGDEESGGRTPEDIEDSLLDELLNQKE